MTNLIPLLIIALVAGYTFSSVWNGSFYNAAREQGHRLYFRSVFYAIFLTVCSGFLHVIFISCDVWLYILYADALAYWFAGSNNADLDNEVASKSAILFNTLPLAIILAGLLSASSVQRVRNLRLPWTQLYPFDWWERLLLKRATSHNDFEKLVARSFFAKMPLLATLHSQKIYIGWVVAAPNPGYQRRYLRLLPIFSGYRTPVSHEIEFTTDYINVLTHVRNSGTGTLDHLDVDDLEVVVPTDQITSIHPFDLDAYEHFLAGEWPTEDVNDEGEERSDEEQAQ